MRQHPEITARASQMYSIIEKYFASNLSRKTFCEREGITYSTFQWWLGKYRQHQSGNDNQTTQQINDFVPIHVTAPESSDSRASACHIEYPNGVVVRLGDIDVQLIRQLVQGGNS